MTVTTQPAVRTADTVEEAVALLSALPGAVPLAGGTWVMRGGVRGEAMAPVYVSVGAIPELGKIDQRDPLVVGAAVTHTRLASLDLPPAAAALGQAAAVSAFTQVRHRATVAGNIASVGFAEADLVPALAALDARLVVASPRGRTRVPLADFLPTRGARPVDELIVAVEVPVADDWASGYARLTVRGGGEYPLVTVGLAVHRDASGVVRQARVAVGSVEELPRRVPEAEAALIDAVLTPATARAAGVAAASVMTSRDALDGPGWYRLAVLPSVVRQAAARIPASGEEDE
jgi:carbon-monoxide dehydrogenase medium subunit